MKGDPSPRFIGSDQSAEGRHRETVVIGVMSTATIVLVGMFGLIEILGKAEVPEHADDVVRQVSGVADVAIPMLSTAVVVLYAWCVVAGTDTILHAFRDENAPARRQYIACVSVFQLMVILVAIVASLTIVVRAVVA